MPLASPLGIAGPLRFRGNSTDHTCIAFSENVMLSTPTASHSQRIILRDCDALYPHMFPLLSFRSSVSCPLLPVPSDTWPVLGTALTSLRTTAGCLLSASSPASSTSRSVLYWSSRKEKRLNVTGPVPALVSSEPSSDSPYREGVTVSVNACCSMTLKQFQRCQPLTPS